MNKQKMVERIADNIIDNVHNDSGYRDLAEQLIKHGLKSWTIAEMKDFLGDEGGE